MAELVVVILLLGFFVSLGLAVVIAGKRLLPGRFVEVQGEVLAVSPSPDVFAEAVRLNGLFIDRLRMARAIYVFGGRHESLPSGASRSGLRPLGIRAVPRLNLRNGMGLNADAYGFYQEHASDLGPMETVGDPGDFTILVIGPDGGRLAATALVQVRQKAVSVGDQAGLQQFVRFETELFDSSGDARSYTFLEKPEVAQASQVGAEHFWYRYSEGRVAEEGPVLAVLPDPWLYAGTSSAQVAQGVPAAFSRFVYTLCVSP